MVIDTKETQLRSKNNRYSWFKTLARSIYNNNGVKEKDVTSQK